MVRLSSLFAGPEDRGLAVAAAAILGFQVPYVAAAGSVRAVIVVFGQLFEGEHLREATYCHPSVTIGEMPAKASDE